MALLFPPDYCFISEVESFLPAAPERRQSCRVNKPKSQVKKSAKSGQVKSSTVAIIRTLTLVTLFEKDILKKKVLSKMT